MTRKPPVQTTLAPGLLTTDEAAQWLRVSPRTVKSLPLRRVLIGRSVRYDVKDLQAFADLNGDRDRLTSGSAA